MIQKKIVTSGTLLSMVAICSREGVGMGADPMNGLLSDRPTMVRATLSLRGSGQRDGEHRSRARSGELQPSLVRLREGSRQRQPDAVPVGIGGSTFERMLGIGEARAVVAHLDDHASARRPR